MSFFKELLVCSVPAVAVGGTGVGIWLFAPRNNETIDENEISWRWRGIRLGPDANPDEEDETKDLIRQAGLNCGNAEEKTEEERDCNIGLSGLNVHIGEEKKEGYIPVKDDNGNLRFRLLKEDGTYSNKFKFFVTDKPIKLENKSNSSEKIILGQNDTYQIVKDNDTNKVYLTRKFTAGEWIKKSLGLPNGCNLPTEVSKDTFDYKNATCTISSTEIKSVKFDGKKSDGPSTTDNVKLYIHKVHDSKTFRGGYKFTFHPFQDVEISAENKLFNNVWWDFRLKDPNAEDLVLERVWKTEGELLEAVGLTCTTDTNICTINDGSLKVKSGINYLEKGKKNSESKGTLKVERKRSGHYEGLRFSIHGGEIEINNDSDSTVKMEELEIFHIRKEDSRETSHVLARKHGLEEMILYHLGLNSPGCSLPKGEEKSKECIIEDEGENKRTRKIKFHDGTGEKTITGNDTNELVVIITSVEEGEKENYPLGYKISIKTSSGNITVGSITLSNSPTEFKIKKEEVNNEHKLYLEKVS